MPAAGAGILAIGAVLAHGVRPVCQAGGALAAGVGHQQTMTMQVRMLYVEKATGPELDTGVRGLSACYTLTLTAVGVPNASTQGLYYKG